MVFFSLPIGSGFEIFETSGCFFTSTCVGSGLLIVAFTIGFATFFQRPPPIGLN